MSSILILFITYGEASRLIFNQIRSKTLSLVLNTVRLIDSDALQRYIDAKGIETNADFRKLKSEITKIQNLNRRTDIFIEDVYIITKERNSNHYYIVINAKQVEDFGSKYETVFPVHALELSTPYVTKKIYSDSSGSWITGYAPIFDRKGKEVGLLGIDVQTKEIYLQLEKLLFYGFIAFVISIFLGGCFAYFLSKFVSSSLSILCRTVKIIGEGDFSARSSLRTQDEFNELAIAINHMAKGVEERERLKLCFASYVSKYALDELLKLDQPIVLKGERKKITVLFSDIRQFSTIAEKLPPEKVLQMLNEYFKEMIEIIFQYKGTLDKFIGDGLMVGFGAPLQDDLQELHAVSAAIQMQKRLKVLCEKWIKEGRAQLSIGIGIHTGLAILGTVGSERRMEYTAIGDTVNIAARLEQLTKQLKKPIIISQSVYDKVKDHFVFEELCMTKLTGRVGDIKIYALHPKMQKT